MNLWEKNTPGSGHSICKGPVAGSCLTCSKKGREAGVAGWRGKEKKIERK